MTQELLGRGRVLLAVAHPDDETLAAASLLTRGRDLWLVHATDGAPRDPQYRPAKWRQRSREDYAACRRAELDAALALAGLGPRRQLSLGLVDLEAADALVELAGALAAVIARREPELVVTHDYAGGHPDHDAMAWAVRAAANLRARAGARPPTVYEFPLYHGADGQMCVGQFVPRERPIDAITLILSPAQLRRKHAMLDCFASQREMLAAFRPLDTEQVRVAPSYDFTQPPHPGPLLYERWEFPWTGAQWRRRAAAAARELQL